MKTLLASLLLLSFSFPASAGPAKFYADGPKDKQVFALTYDDGPGGTTEPLLELLARHGAKATFFMTGYAVRARPALARKVAEAGHLVGNHTDKHEFYPKVDKRADREKFLAAELDRGAASIEKAAGVRVSWLRMPNGFDRDWVRRVAGEKGYTIANWGYGSDWTGLSEEKMAAEYLKALGPGKILLMHDGGGKPREKTLRITEKLLQEAARRGLKPVRLDELFAPKHPGK